MARLVSTTDIFASPALPLLLRLEGEGFDLLADGDRLRVHPSDRVTSALLTALRLHKADLLLLLRCRDAGVQARRNVFECQLAAMPAPRVPAFLFRSGVPYIRATCFSCGDGLPEPRYGRCWRCSLAWRLTCRLPVDAVLAAALDAAKVCA